MSRNQTLLHFSNSDKVIMWLGFPLIGLVLGWFLPSIAKWSSSLAWIPFFEGPLKLIASYDGVWVGIITMILGLIAGVAFTFLAFHESLEISLYDDKVVLKLRDDETILNKNDIALVFMDKKQIVLIGHDKKELFRFKQELTKHTVGAAFIKHHYPWSDTDPFHKDFKTWVVDSPDLSPAANALLKARKIALEAGNDEEAFQLVQELWKLRVSVKENDKRQYYR